MTNHDNEPEYLGDLPEVGGPATNRDRAPAHEPSASVAAVLGEGLGETRAELRELRDQVQQVLDRLTGADEKYDLLRAKQTELAEVVTALAETLHQQDQKEDPEPPRPMDWAQVPVADRTSWVQDRVDWVRDVLFTNYDHAPASLRPCWPLHTTLLNDASLLEWIYTDGFGDLRLVSAESFRRTLEVMLERAERLTRGCPQPDAAHLHPVPMAPRDDTAQVELLAKNLALRETFGYYLQGAAIQDELNAKGEDATEADRLDAQARLDILRERTQATMRNAGVKAKDWQEFKEQAERQQKQAEAVLSSEGTRDKKPTK
ncbi:hypothetical protein NE857_33755 (plasmid) [Nocardiopsis exhalans]|uniref:Uncharacterized protein n=1 Tax=Nocardiopsis exhalans TaxID=163604 RepID=A0ABY5DJ30_9ACTN|nr:hypothetical protein [Nocardiopsis exhalans]USY23598.1 hypothetical protein NE857_33755 [Nocardiopsis exhalans]